MSKQITRKYIKRVANTNARNNVRQSSGGGGGGGGASQFWVEDNYISKLFFNRLFTVLDEDGNAIEPNDTETVIESIQSMFGFWSNLYISALGQGSGGSAAAVLAYLLRLYFGDIRHACGYDCGGVDCGHYRPGNRPQLLGRGDCGDNAGEHIDCGSGYSHILRLLRLRLGHVRPVLVHIGDGREDARSGGRGLLIEVERTLPEVLLRIHIGLLRLQLTGAEVYMRVLYYVLVGLMAVTGIVVLAMRGCRSARWERIRARVSLGVHAAGVLLLINGLQPYAATLLFVSLVLKVLLLLKWR